MTLAKEIAEFYAVGREAARLLKGMGRVEFARLQELMCRYLPAPPSLVADIGGGPGAYACWLAGQGYAVHLVDPVPLHVQQARQASAAQPAHPLAAIEIGDARELALPDASVDAVLLHGPMYHLTETSDRLLALAEARRVLRSGGVLLAVAISPYTSAMVGVIRGWIGDGAYMGMVRKEIATGQHQCPPGWDLFTTSFFHHPNLLRSETEQAGLHHETTLGIQGPGWMALELKGGWEDEGQRQAVIELARLMEHEPVHSPHMLAVAKKLPQAGRHTP